MTLLATETPSRRASILDAALTAFTTSGYEATSIEEICANAPASVGSFYHHFGSKEGVAAALYVEAVDRFQASLRAALAEPLSPQAMVSILVSSHLTWVRDNEMWAKYLLQMGSAPAAAAAQPSVTGSNRALFDAVAAWSTPLVDEGVIVPFEPAALIAQILGPSYFATRVWLAGGPEISDRLIQQFGDSAWRSIQNPGAMSASRLR